MKALLRRVRIYGPNGTAVASNAAPAAARRSGAGFALSESDAAQGQSQTVALRTLGGIDALIALQGVEDPVERRRRAIKQGRRALYCVQWAIGKRACHPTPVNCREANGSCSSHVGPQTDGHFVALDGSDL